MEIYGYYYMEFNFSELKDPKPVLALNYVEMLIQERSCYFKHSAQRCYMRKEH